MEVLTQRSAIIWGGCPCVVLHFHVDFSLLAVPICWLLKNVHLRADLSLNALKHVFICQRVWVEGRCVCTWWQTHWILDDARDMAVLGLAYLEYIIDLDPNVCQRTQGTFALDTVQSGGNEGEFDIQRCSGASHEDGNAHIPPALCIEISCNE